MRLIQLNWSQKASLRDIWVKELEGENRHSFKVWEREHSRSKGPVPGCAVQRPVWLQCGERRMAGVQMVSNRAWGCGKDFGFYFKSEGKPLN